MQRQARSDTQPELALRRELHRRGLRYRLHRRAFPALRRRLDIVFASARVAVEVRGCFWHRCPQHGSAPKANSGWWNDKFARTAARDDDTADALRRAGWVLVVVWEHEDIATAADRVTEALSLARRAALPGAIHAEVALDSAEAVE